MRIIKLRNKSDKLVIVADNKDDEQATFKQVSKTTRFNFDEQIKDEDFDEIVKIVQKLYAKLYNIKVKK